jgi:hypothetical protein
VICTELAGALRFLARANDGDDRRAEMLGPLHEDRADAADRGMNQQRIALAHAIDLAQQHLRCQALQHQRSSLSIVDAVGDAHQPLGGQHARFAVSAGGIERVGDAVADFDLADARADGLDYARCLAAEHRGKRHRIQAGALVGIDEVEPDRRVPDAHLARTGVGDLDAVPAQNFRAAVRMNSHRMCHAANGR